MRRTASALRRIRGTQTGQFAAKQYNRPAPPVLIKSFWLQPPSGPREGCAAFQELIVGEGVPVRSACPSIAEPCVLLVQFLQVLSSPAGNAVPSARDPVSTSWRFGASPHPVLASPLSVSAVFFVEVVLPGGSAASFALTTPLAFCQGPLPLRSRAFTARL